jgi:hypothetical protein
MVVHTRIITARPDGDLHVGVRPLRVNVGDYVVVSSAKQKIIIRRDWKKNKGERCKVQGNVNNPFIIVSALYELLLFGRDEARIECDEGKKITITRKGPPTSTDIAIAFLNDEMIRVKLWAKYGLLTSHALSQAIEVIRRKNKGDSDLGVLSDLLNALIRKKLRPKKQGDDTRNIKPSEGLISKIEGFDLDTMRQAAQTPFDFLEGLSLEDRIALFMLAHK